MKHFNIAVELKKYLWWYFHGLLQSYQYSVGGLASYGRYPLLSVGGISFCGGEGGIELGSKILMYVWKLLYLLTLVVRKKYLLRREHLFWTLFLTSQYFGVHEISQFWKLTSFSQRNTKSKSDSRFVRVFWRKISFIFVNKSTRYIQISAFAKIIEGKNIAVYVYIYF